MSVRIAVMSIKQPREIIDLEFDFRNRLVDGESIVTAEVEVDDPTLTLVGTAVISGSRVVQWVSGGTSGVTYKLTCLITTDNVPARKWELELKLPVEEL
jgi:hypothetical protein